MNSECLEYLNLLFVQIWTNVNIPTSTIATIWQLAAIVLVLSTVPAQRDTGTRGQATPTTADGNVIPAHLSTATTEAIVATSTTNLFASEFLSFHHLSFLYTFDIAVVPIKNYNWNLLSVTFLEMLKDRREVF